MISNNKFKIVDKDTLDCIKNTNKIIINTTKWKEYKLVDLFEIKRGKRLRSVDRKEGDIRYFSATNENNGVSCYISNPLFIESNSLVFNTFGGVFFSDKEFTGSDEVTILKNRKLNKKSGLYLSSLMTKMFDEKFGYNKKAFYKEIIKETIKLPSKINTHINKYEPDWEYMEDYIANLEKSLNINQIKIKIDVLKSMKKESIDITKWKEYKIDDLFILKRGKNSKKPKEAGNIPYVSATSQNNGINLFVDSDEDKIFKGNKITVANNGSVGETFYQKNDFCASSDVTVLGLKNIDLNVNIAMFLIPIIKNCGYKYNYGSKWGLVKMKEDIIKLPSFWNEDINDFSPNWDYMEKIILDLK